MKQDDTTQHDPSHWRTTTSVSQLRRRERRSGSGGGGEIRAMASSLRPQDGDAALRRAFEVRVSISNRCCPRMQQQSNMAQARGTFLNARRIAFDAKPLVSFRLTRFYIYTPTISVRPRM